jgi:hypothetical protein
MSLQIPRPVDPSLHPLVTGNYRLATPAIEVFYELVMRCLRYRIMGALIYGPSRVGKTRAIEYVRLLLAREYPKITTYHAQCEHRPRHAEGPFFANLLDAVGDHAPNAGTLPPVIAYSRGCRALRKQCRAPVPRRSPEVQ